MSNRSLEQARIDALLLEFRTSGNLDNAFDALAARKLRENITDLHCLNILESRSGLTAGELALEAGLTSGAVTGVIDRLERAGYVRRAADPGDRRKVKVEVTSAFYELRRRDLVAAQAELGRGTRPSLHGAPARRRHHVPACDERPHAHAPRAPARLDLSGSSSGGRARSDAAVTTIAGWRHSGRSTHGKSRSRLPE